MTSRLTSPLKVTRVSTRAGNIGIIAVVLAAVAACASTPQATTPAATPSALPSASATPSATPTPTPTPTPTSPLTGLAQESAKPVLIVKLDNTPNAQPHAGLADADVVYVEEVEYGITRLAAVFSSSMPTRIGPVRSARITDIDLVAQYGNPAFAFSGAQRRLWPALAEGSFIDVSANKGGTGYSRDTSRAAPYNYFADGSVMIERAGPDVSLTPEFGWEFSSEPPLGGQPAEVARADWSYASIRFLWDPVAGNYSIRMNERAAQAEETETGQRADTVVFQLVEQVPSEYKDRWGGVTPHALTIGEGTALVLRDGRSWEVRWSRPDAESGTTFTLPDGSVMPFAPGQTWVVLLDRTREVKVRNPSLSGTPSAAASSSATPAQ